MPLCVLVNHGTELIRICGSHVVMQTGRLDTRGSWTEQRSVRKKPSISIYSSRSTEKIQRSRLICWHTLLIRMSKRMLTGLCKQY